MKFLPQFHARILFTAAGLILFLLLGMPVPAQANVADDFMFAVKFDSLSSVLSLLKQGVDPNSFEPLRGETALMIALRENSMKVFASLLEHPDIQLEARAQNGDTALMLACYLGNLVAVERLIARGAEINRPGWTALHYAATHGDLQIIGVLLEHSAYIDAHSPNKTTPLMMAVSTRKLSAVQLLLEEGADWKAKNDAGLSALDFAIQFEFGEIEKYLADWQKRSGK